MQPSIYVLTEEGRCLSLRGIVDSMKLKDNVDLDDVEIDRQLMSTLSSTISTNAKSHRHTKKPRTILPRLQI